MKKSLNSCIPILIVILLSFFSVWTLFIPGYFPMHDDTQPSRVFVMAQALHAGQFPVRWVDDLGYGFGYPLFNFYPPLPYYIGAIFHLMGLDIISATKLMMMFAMIFSALSMYVFVSTLLGKLEGMVSAIFYLYAPYHAVNLYVRGAVGELYAYAFLPIFLLGLIYIARVRYKKGIVITGIGLAALLLSHNILGMITLYFCIGGIIWYLFSTLRVRVIPIVFYLILFAIITGIGLSAFFTFPAIAENKFTRVNELTTGGSDFRNHFVTLDQLWDSPWGFAGSAPGRFDGMSFKIGKGYLIPGIAGFVMLFIFAKKKKITRLHLQIGKWLLVIFLISIFMMTEFSIPVWEILPLASFIQYPWRFLNISILTLCIILSLLVRNIPKSLKLPVAAIFISATILINYKYFTPQFITPANADEYIHPDKLRYKISKISDEYMPPDFKLPLKDGKLYLPAYGLWENRSAYKIIESRQSPSLKKYTIDYIDEDTSEMISAVSYFPGWEVYIDSRKVPIRNLNGQIAFNISKGQHEIIFKLKNTPVRSAANSISLFSIILLGYVAITPRFHREDPDKNAKK